MRLISSPETSVRNRPTLRNNPEDGRIQVNRSGSLRSREVKVLLGPWCQELNCDCVVTDNVRLKTCVKQEESQ